MLLVSVCIIGAVVRRCGWAGAEFALFSRDDIRSIF